MGHKVNPVGLRLGINRTWIRAGTRRPLPRSVERGPQDPRVPAQAAQAGRGQQDRDRAAGEEGADLIHTARPGVVIGKKGQEIEALRKELARRTTGDVHLNIVEIRKPEIDARLVAENIAQQLERRVTFRRAMKRAVQSAMRLGAQGIRELPGPPRRRRDRAASGTARAACRSTRCAPTSTFGRATAFTPYGTNGVKVWVFKGEIMEHDPTAHDRRLSETASVRT